MLSQPKKKRPIFECIDVRVTAQDVQLKQPFVKIGRMIATYEWDATTVDFGEFAGGAALTNGIQLIQKDQEVLCFPIKTLFDHSLLSYDSRIEPDTKGVVKQIHFASRLSFHKFMGNEEGIDVTEFPLITRVQDDLSARGNSLSWMFEGWAWDR